MKWFVILDKSLFNKHMPLCMIHAKLFKEAFVSRVQEVFDAIAAVLSLINVKAKYG